MENKNKGGRPTKMTEEKIRQLKAVCRMKPTLEDASELIGVGKRTIERYCKEVHGVSFGEFRQQNMAWTRHMIFREIIEQCKKGNPAMLIWASKNLLGWSDKQEVKESSEIKVIVPDERATKL